ncbi:MAG: hypothetical protein MUE69_05875, partial [Myxococcota bacterium]|nr:hypothetical protein [Myxococcota bacterium]
ELGGSRRFIAHEAHQEVEVWVLAGLADLPKIWKWADVRKECHPKETYFEPHAARRGLGSAPFGGRESLAEEAARNLQRVSKLCPDFAALEQRVEEVLST